MDHGLGDLRERIEEIDRRILAALRERMDLVERIVEAKLAVASPLRDREREEQLLGRLREVAVEAGLDAREVEALYRVILRMSVARQTARVREMPEVPLRVAYQGVEGAFSHEACRTRYAGREGGVLLTGYSTVSEAGEAVRLGRADVGLLPIENSTAGSINETYDLLAEGDLAITGEVIRPIRHALLGLPEAGIDAIRQVLSHPQALSQCAEFLRRHPGIEARPALDTAGAAREVRERGDARLAAIASAAAAPVYGLKVLADGIQSQAANFTRFFEVAREPAEVPAEAACKTSLSLAVAHEAGALGDVLAIFKRRSVNLTKLESRPIPERPWQYRFYLDLEGHAEEERVADALEEARALTTDLRVLGSYARSDAAPGD